MNRPLSLVLSNGDLFDALMDSCLLGYLLMYIWPITLEHTFSPRHEQHALFIC